MKNSMKNSKSMNIDNCGIENKKFKANINNPNRLICVATRKSTKKDNNEDIDLIFV